MIEQDVSSRIDSGVIELQRDVLRLGHPLRVKLHGMSMYPMIRAGDVVVVRSVPWTALRRGDVAYYERDCRLVAHRVMAAPFDENAPVITKGDTLPNFDPPVRPEQFIGRVEAIERNGRTISLVGKAFWKQRLAVELSGPYSALFWKGAAARRRILKGMLRVPAYRSRRRRSNSAPFVIRPYRDEDLDQLANCVWDLRLQMNFAQVRSWLHGALGEMQNAGGRVWIAEDERRVVGMASLLTEGSAASIPDWYLHPLARGFGWGEQILARMEKEATTNGTERLRLALPVDSVAAKRLLRKKGWEKRSGQKATDLPRILPRSTEEEDIWTLDLSVRPSSPEADETARPSSVA